MGDYYRSGEERLRLWYMEKQPEIALKFAEMRRDNNAALGQRIRDALRRRPDDHQTVLALCRRAEEEEFALANLLNEGVEAEAARLQTAYMQKLRRIQLQK